MINEKGGRGRGGDLDQDEAIGGVVHQGTTQAVQGVGAGGGGRVRGARDQGIGGEAVT